MKKFQFSFFYDQEQINITVKAEVLEQDLTIIYRLFTDDSRLPDMYRGQQLFLYQKDKHRYLPTFPFHQSGFYIPMMQELRNHLQRHYHGNSN